MAEGLGARVGAGFFVLQRGAAAAAPRLTILAYAPYSAAAAARDRAAWRRALSREGIRVSLDVAGMNQGVREGDKRS